MEKETTIIIQGFRVTVGKDDKSGIFEYVKTKKEAEKKGKEIKKGLELSGTKDWIIDIQEIDLKKCDNDFCKRLCEKGERYCLSCDELLYDAQIEMAERERGEEIGDNEM